METNNCQHSPKGRRDGFGGYTCSKCGEYYGGTANRAEPDGAKEFMEGLLTLAADFQKNAYTPVIARIEELLAQARKLGYGRK
jgi:hypothetical protein